MMKLKSLAALIPLALSASCGSQPSENSADNVATDYGVVVDAAAASNDADAMMDTSLDSVGNAMDSNGASANTAADPGRSEPYNDVTVRNKQR
jgi:hypothetical protein